MYSKILLPTDGSNYSEKAIKEAVNMAKKIDAEVTIFHVIPRPSEYYLAPGMGGPADDFKSVIEQLERNGIEILKKIESDYKDYGLKITTKHIIGDPAEEIIKEARDGGYDSIIMSNRGLGGIKSFLMGSVSNKVVKHAGCSVTIVR